MIRYEVGIVVATTRELNAIKGLFKSGYTEHRLGYEYEIAGGGQTFIGYLGEISNCTILAIKGLKQGSVHAAMATLQLLREGRPQLLILSGIAGSLSESIQLGDVVFSDSIYAYEYKKILDVENEISEQSEARVIESRFSVIKSYCEEFIKERNKEVSEKPRFHFEKIASGSKIVASKALKSKMGEVERQAKAVEMESEGFASVAVVEDIPFFVVKAISDFAGKDKVEGFAQNGTQDTAVSNSANAVSLFIEFISEKLRWIKEKSQMADSFDVFMPKNEEKSFIELIGYTPSIKIGDFDTKCQVFPETAFKNPNQHIYTDFGVESNNKLIFHMLEDTATLEASKDFFTTLEKILTENKEYIEYEKFVSANQNVRDGNNQYPRLIHKPIEINGSLHLILGKNNFFITDLSSRIPAFPNLRSFMQEHIVNSLAVRVCLVFQESNQKIIAFQKRGESNSTYSEAWDVAAAGYIDPIKHIHNEYKKLSAYVTARNELVEEQNIEFLDLPNQERFSFFGICRMELTNSFDIIALCETDQDIGRHRSPRESVKKVSEFGYCALNPKDVADFIAEKKYWIPGAIISLYMTLRYFGFSNENILAEFSPIINQIRISPD